MHQYNVSVSPFPLVLRVFQVPTAVGVILISGEGSKIGGAWGLRERSIYLRQESAHESCPCLEQEKEAPKYLGQQK